MSYNFDIPSPSKENKPGMIKLYKPTYEDLWFRQRLMADSETMSYNHAWGGTIPFPKADWQEWFDRWLCGPEEKRFYRYIITETDDAFVGEIAYHYDEEREIHIANVIVLAEHRGKGYGKLGLHLLCEVARTHGVRRLYDDIAIDNPAVSLFLKAGFAEEYRTEQIIMLKKELDNGEPVLQEAVSSRICMHSCDG